MTNGGWQWRINTSYRNLTHEQWTILQSLILQSYGTWADFYYYMDDIYKNGTGFDLAYPIEFEVDANTSRGSNSVVLNNVNTISTANYFKTGDILFHPNLGPGNMNIVAADAQVGATTTTIYFVRPIRAALTAGATISMAEYINVSLASKDWNVTRGTHGYYDIDIDFLVRDKFRNYQNG